MTKLGKYFKPKKKEGITNMKIVRMQVHCYYNRILKKA